MPGLLGHDTIWEAEAEDGKLKTRFNGERRRLEEGNKLGHFSTL